MDVFSEIDQLHKRQKERVEAARDGTPNGELKARYLEVLYNRANTANGLELLLAPGGFRGDEPICEEYRDKLDKLDGQLSALEQELSDAGVTIRKIRSRPH